jgi:subtilisin family serine protease
MAPRATIINQSFSNIIVNAPAYTIDNNMVLTNNSYHSVEAGCAGNGKYDVLSKYVDAQMKAYPQLLHVVAAGNDGTYSCGIFPSSFATVKSGMAISKNVLTVTAMNADDYSIAYFSSRGPVKDGRLKPEITAGGWQVMSTNANDTYGVNFGTSMAAPVVTGTLALMYERYRQKHGGSDPTASLMKALVCNTAEDLGNAGPDYTFGFGMLNAGRAVEAIDSNRYLINAVGNGGTTSHVINVPAGARRLKVMLYWADNEAAVNAAATLVNDLDLTVTEPSSFLHRPLILNPAPSNVNDPLLKEATIRII